MASWITVTGLKPWDGRYELDIDDQPLTTREWGWIKRHTGYLPLTLTSDAFSDPELVTMLTLIAMRRAGKITTEQVTDVWDRLADAPFGTVITIDADQDDEEAVPLAAETSEKPGSSGASSPNGSDSSAGPPSRTGSPASATSESTPETSVR